MFSLIEKGYILLKSTLSSGFSAFLILAPESRKNMIFPKRHCHFLEIHATVKTSAPFSLWSSPPKNAGLLPELLFGENLHGVVRVVLLVVRQLHNPIAALAHHPLKRQFESCFLRRQYWVKKKCADVLYFYKFNFYLELVLVELDVVSVLFARHSLRLFQRLAFHPGMIQTGKLRTSVTLYYYLFSSVN